MKLIAETAWHHEGDITFLKNLATGIAKSQADVAKFHLLLDLDEYIDQSHSLYDKYKLWNITTNDWLNIFEIVKNKELMLLCNDTKAIEFAAGNNPDIIEIHAVCMADLNMLDALKQNIGSTTRIALGISGNKLDEIDFTLNYLGNKNIILMYGFQNYPTDLNHVNLNKLNKIMKFYSEYEFGYADHCGYNESFNEFVTLSGAALGVEFIEKHVTTQPGIKRIDYEAAIGFKELDQIKSRMNDLSAVLGSGELKFNSGEQSYARLGILKKAPISKFEIKAGQPFTRECVAMKRVKTEYDFSPHDVILKFGGVFKHDIPAGSVIRPLDIEL